MEIPTLLVDRPMNLEESGTAKNVPSPDITSVLAAPVNPFQTWIESPPFVAYSTTSLISRP